MISLFENYSRTAGDPIIIHYAFQLPEQNGMPAIEVLAQPTSKTAKKAVTGRQNAFRLHTSHQISVKNITEKCYKLSTAVFFVYAA